MFNELGLWARRGEAEAWRGVRRVYEGLGREEDVMLVSSIHLRLSWFGASFSPSLRGDNPSLWPKC